MWYNAAARAPAGAAHYSSCMLEGLLPRTYVAIDLETTGLSAERDAII